eukprot:scaffold8917_cov111-Cylindrotheca_fusiformis.AAC.3
MVHRRRQQQQQQQQYHMMLLQQESTKMKKMVPPAVSKRSRKTKQLLPSSFVPSQWDIICHHGKDPRDHAGNRRFKLFIENYLENYLSAHSRGAKSGVISEIVTFVRAMSIQAGGSGFVRYDSDLQRWYEVGDKVARDKVGHCLREARDSKNRSRKKEHGNHEPDHSLSSNTTAPTMSFKPNEHSFQYEHSFHYSLVDALGDPNPSSASVGLPDEEFPCRLSNDDGWTSTKELCDWFEAEMDQ